MWWHLTRQLWHVPHLPLERRRPTCREPLCLGVRVVGYGRTLRLRDVDLIDNRKNGGEDVAPTLRRIEVDADDARHDGAQSERGVAQVDAVVEQQLRRARVAQLQLRVQVSEQHHRIFVVVRTRERGIDRDDRHVGGDRYEHLEESPRSREQAGAQEEQQRFRVAQAFVTRGGVECDC